MKKDELIKYMSFNREGTSNVPLAVFEINGTYLLGIYQGAISEFDILIKYRQKLSNQKWSNLRTPKHIHWAVDMLIKQHEDKQKTQEFLDYLIGVWKETKPARSTEEQRSNLDMDFLLIETQEHIAEYESLGSKGEYSIKFLILLAKLLMIQEKTNLETAFMFGKLLDALRDGKDIFSIVSTATHR